MIFNGFINLFNKKMSDCDLISIIVPVYNVELYIKNCVKTIINQTYKNIEIILIDDGSTDNSGKACDELAQTDKRIITIHKKNDGVSSARNAGLDIASGNFVTFVDADDTIKPDFIQTLHDNFEDSVDMTVCAYACVNEKNEITYFSQKTKNEKEIFSREQAIEIMLYGKVFAGHCWNKMFRKSLLTGLRFNTEMPLYEDLLFVTEYLLKAKKVSYASECLYNYFARTTSASRGKMTSSKLKAFDALNVIDSKLKANYGSWFDSFVNYDRAVWALNCYAILCYDKKNRKTYNSFLKKQIKDYGNNKHLCKKEKIKVFLIKINPALFYFAYKSIKKQS